MSKIRNEHAFRAGFTLVEGLVASAIIGLLLALLIPAVLMAREAARRGACINNLKQIGLAVHSYHESKNVYPAALGGASQSILVELLPYMDSSSLYNQFNFSQQIDDMSNRTALSSRPSQFACPSDSYYPYPNSTSYAGNIGDASYKSRNNGFFDIFGNPAGANHSSAAITDGMSQTACVAEWLINRISAPPDQRRTFYRPAKDDPKADISRDRFAINCDSLEGYTPDATEIKGLDWYSGRWSRTLYDHMLKINSHSCYNTWNSTVQGTCPAGSMHSGGANVAFGDGHVRFIRDYIEISVWRSLGTRSGGEVIPGGNF